MNLDGWIQVGEGGVSAKRGFILLYTQKLPNYPTYHKNMRILIVRIGRAGDVVMMTPALSAIIRCYPDAKITFLTGLDGPRLLKGYHPNLDELWVWNRSGVLAYFNKRKILQKLDDTKFDKIFCFETNKKIAKIFSRYDADLCCLEQTSKDVHCSQHYLDLVNQACPSLDETFYAHLPVREDASRHVDEELSALGISSSDTLIILHPTYSGYTSNPLVSLLSKKHHIQSKHRLWPASKFSELGSMLSELTLAGNSNPKVIIDLIPDEAEQGNKIIKNSPDSITLLLEPPNIERYKALIKRADLLVTPNTGPLHIAAAVDTKIVALFSGWSPIDCGPFMKPDRFAVLRAEDTPNPESGLSSIPVNAVFEACRESLLSS